MVRDYYYAHFAELDPEHQFHFATRMKNYFKIHDFDDFLAQHQPSTDLAPILANNDFSRVNHYGRRKPYFEKYSQIYAIEAALFRVNHLLNEYMIDVRADLLQKISKTELYELSDRLLADTGAIATLSTWAVNVICLTEILFPRGFDTIGELTERALKISQQPEYQDPLLLVYLLTHIVLCDTNFYTRPVTNPVACRQLIERCAELVEANFEELTLDTKVEFLTCANLTGQSFPALRAAIADECRTRLKTKLYLTDARRSEYYHTLNGAEHCNVLFIMSGLDAEIHAALD